jgi:hypothetical protein
MSHVAGSIRTGHHPRFVKLLAAFALLLLVCLSGLQTALGRVPKQLVELCLGGLLLAAFLAHPAVARARKSVSPLAARLAVAWPLVVILADASRPRSPWLFPLDGWHMFAGRMGKAPDPEQFRYWAHFADGGSARLMPGAGVSDVVSSALDGELKQLLERTLRAPADQALRARATAAIHGIARMQEAEDPAHPIRGVTVERCRLPVRAPYRAECAKVWTLTGPTP